jgi:hypothetical protein
LVCPPAEGGANACAARISSPIHIHRQTFCRLCEDKTDDDTAPCTRDVETPLLPRIVCPVWWVGPYLPLVPISLIKHPPWVMPDPFTCSGKAIQELCYPTKIACILHIVHANSAWPRVPSCNVRRRAGERSARNSRRRSFMVTFLAGVLLQAIL